MIESGFILGIVLTAVSAILLGFRAVLANVSGLVVASLAYLLVFSSTTSALLYPEQLTNQTRIFFMQMSSISLFPVFLLVLHLVSFLVKVILEVRRGE